MAVFNVVRFRVAPGNEQRFIDAHREARFAFEGFVAGNLVRTGERTFCVIGEWRDPQALAAARPHMIAILDTFRDLLEDLGGGLGVTDPVSGEVVARLAAPRAAAKRPARAAKKRPAKKRPAEKRPAKKRARR
jgi:quinol monooxygenase YgiN